GDLYTPFASPADDELALNSAKQLDIVVWEKHRETLLFGSLDGHTNIEGLH
ncbi:hypothetical protein DFH07DRAFT_755530, partial [Mycena maculata]